MNDDGEMTVAVVHGIGVSEPGYAAELIAGIRREFIAALRRGNHPPPDPLPLTFIEIVWDDIVAEQQQELSARLKSGLERWREPTLWEKWFAPLLAPLQKGARWLRTDFAAQYISDVIAYRNPQVYEKIQQRILERLKGGGGPLTFVAHSLGTVITSDLIYDRCESGSGFPGYTMTNFFTLGSPLAVFALRYGTDAFASPVHMEDPDGRWINILDRDDPLAYPLKPLNAAYERAVEKDVEVDTGLFGIAHVKYWKNPATHRIIAAKLVADYLRHR